MADDLAAKLAAAIVRAAVMAAGNHSDYSPAYVRSTLATDLRDLLPACYFCSQPARTLEAGYAVCEPMFHAGQRERLEDVAPPGYADLVARLRDIRVRHLGAPIEISDVLHDAAEALESVCGDYSAPDWTPDERHRHTVGGQTWEHAHEGGHEAHSAVSHDLSDSDLIFPTGTTVADDLRELAEDLHNGDIPRRAAETVRLAANLLDGAPEARPEPPSAVSEALDAARVFLHRVDHFGTYARERDALRDALSRVDELDAAERARRYALGEEHGAMGGTL